MTSSPPPVPTSFRYQAQTDQGDRLSGQIDAPDVAAASQRLAALRLRIIEIAPEASAFKSKAIRGDDFLAFNQQLAQLAKAGMPIERGLRLIAADMRRGRLAQTVSLIATELERGTPLPEAFDRYRSKFPTLYGRLIEAGVRGGNLPGVLLGLGRHLETEQRLRATLWRTFSYPLMVFVGLLLVVAFLSHSVLPQFELMYNEFHIQLPFVTIALLSLGHALPYLAGVVILLVVLVPILWALLRMAGKDRMVIDKLILPLPLVGPVLKASLIARWLEAARIGVSAGIDLPAAMDLAGDATGSPGLVQDGRILTAALQAGQPIVSVRTRLLPATVPAAIEFSAGHNDLTATLETLVELYQRQADLRLDTVPTILTPLLVIFMALSIGMVLAGLFAPLVSLIQGISK